MTKLWQPPGSPIIQGRSRYRRPFLNVWAFSFVVGTVVLVVPIALVSAFPGEASLSVARSVALASSLALWAFPGLAAGSAAGTWLARALGSRREWTAGAVSGVLLGAVSMILLVSDLTVRGVTVK